MKGRVLIAAGSDSGAVRHSGDIKTVTALGGYAMTASRRSRRQNTLGVFGILPVDPAFVRRQMELVLADLGADALKTGMLHDAAVIDAIADVIEAQAPTLPLVVDPVLVAKGGALLADAALATLKRRLVRAPPC